jgi:hypothetical protein
VLQRPLIEQACKIRDVRFWMITTAAGLGALMLIALSAWVAGWLGGH